MNNKKSNNKQKQQPLIDENKKYTLTTVNDIKQQQQRNGHETKSQQRRKISEKFFNDSDDEGHLGVGEVTGDSGGMITDRNSSLFDAESFHRHDGGGSQNTSKNRYSFIEYEYLEESSDFNKKFQRFNEQSSGFMRGGSGGGGSGEENDEQPRELNSFNETDTIDEILLIADDGQIENLEVEYKRIKEEEKEAKRRMKYEKKAKTSEKAGKGKKDSGQQARIRTDNGGPLDDIYFKPDNDKDDEEHEQNRLFLREAFMSNHNNNEKTEDDELSNLLDDILPDKLLDTSLMYEADLQHHHPNDAGQQTEIETPQLETPSITSAHGGAFKFYTTFADELLADMDDEDDGDGDGGLDDENDISISYDEVLNKLNFKISELNQVEEQQLPPLPEPLKQPKQQRPSAQSPIKESKIPTPTNRKTPTSMNTRASPTSRLKPTPPKSQPPAQTGKNSSSKPPTNGSTSPFISIENREKQAKTPTPGKTTTQKETASKQRSATSLLKQSPDAKVINQIPPRPASTYYEDKYSFDSEETSVVGELDLEMKLKEEQKKRKMTNELLDQLQSSYNQLLEKHALAENFIDTLRLGAKLQIQQDVVPSSNVQRGNLMDLQKSNLTTNPLTIQLGQNKAQLTTVTAVTASGQQLLMSAPANYANSSTTHPLTTTATTVSVSATNTIPSISNNLSSNDEKERIILGTGSGNERLDAAEYTDEYLSVFGGSNAVSNPPGQIEDQVKTQQSKLGILFQTRQLEDKMESFVTLMDEKQLTSAEQRQVYDSIKKDYEDLLTIYHEAKDDHQYGFLPNEIDLDIDLNTELEKMKDLLKDIVSKLTTSLVLQSPSGSVSIQDRKSSKATSSISSYGNHDEIMDQYNRLLDVFSVDDKPKSIKSDQKSLDDEKLSSNGSDRSLNRSSHQPPTTSGTDVDDGRDEPIDRNKKEQYKLYQDDENSDDDDDDEEDEVQEERSKHSVQLQPQKPKQQQKVQIGKSPRRSSTDSFQTDGHSRSGTSVKSGGTNLIINPNNLRPVSKFTSKQSIQTTSTTSGSKQSVQQQQNSTGGSKHSVPSSTTGSKQSLAFTSTSKKSLQLSSNENMDLDNGYFTMTHNTPHHHLAEQQQQYQLQQQKLAEDQDDDDDDEEEQEEEYEQDKQQKRLIMPVKRTVDVEVHGRKNGQKPKIYVIDQSETSSFTTSEDVTDTSQQQFNKQAENEDDQNTQIYKATAQLGKVIASMAVEKARKQIASLTQQHDVKQTPIKRKPPQNMQMTGNGNKGMQKNAPVAKAYEGSDSGEDLDELDPLNNKENAVVNHDIKLQLQQARANKNGSASNTGGQRVYVPKNIAKIIDGLESSENEQQQTVPDLKYRQRIDSFDRHEQNMLKENLLDGEDDGRDSNGSEHSNTLSDASSIIYRPRKDEKSTKSEIMQQLTDEIEQLKQKILNRKKTLHQKKAKKDEQLEFVSLSTKLKSKSLLDVNQKKYRKHQMVDVKVEEPEHGYYYKPDVKLIKKPKKSVYVEKDEPIYLKKSKTSSYMPYEVDNHNERFDMRQQQRRRKSTQPIIDDPRLYYEQKLNKTKSSLHPQYKSIQGLSSASVGANGFKSMSKQNYQKIPIQHYVSTYDLPLKAFYPTPSQPQLEIPMFVNPKKHEIQNLNGNQKGFVHNKTRTTVKTAICPICDHFCIYKHSKPVPSARSPPSNIEPVFMSQPRKQKVRYYVREYCDVSSASDNEIFYYP